MPEWLPEVVWVTAAFVLGTAVGSFLNVVVGRLPLEKSLLWPNSRCLTCLHSLTLGDNVPILGWLRRRGRCRFCGTPFSSRYLWVELATGLGFALIFYLDAIALWHRMPYFENSATLRINGVPEWQAIVIFVHHATLFSFLLAASLCDWDRKAIPLSLTTTGTLVGLIFATCFPWPWPNDTHIVTDLRKSVIGPGGVRPRFWTIDVDPSRFPEGLYPWPVWGPLPDWLWDHHWALGLLTGLVGAAVGMVMLRAIKFMFERGLGREALGLGDADLMMLSGAFLGWQPVVAAFFVGTFVALPLGIALRFGKSQEDYLPFGPGLALGVMITVYWWPWLGPRLHPFLFDDLLMLIALGLLLGGLFLGSILLRVMGFGAEPAKAGA